MWRGRRWKRCTSTSSLAQASKAVYRVVPARHSSLEWCVCAYRWRKCFVCVRFSEEASRQVFSWFYSCVFQRFLSGSEPTARYGRSLEAFKSQLLPILPARLTGCFCAPWSEDFLFAFLVWHAVYRGSREACVLRTRSQFRDRFTEFRRRPGVFSCGVLGKSFVAAAWALAVMLGRAKRFGCGAFVMIREEWPGCGHV